MINKTIEWNSVQETYPDPDRIIVISFETEEFGTNKLPCFANYSTEDDLFYDEEFRELETQPTFWAYLPQPFSA